MTLPILLGNDIEVGEVERPTLGHISSKWQSQDFEFPDLIHISSILSSVTIHQESPIISNILPPNHVFQPGSLNRK